MRKALLRHGIDVDVYNGGDCEVSIQTEEQVTPCFLPGSRGDPGTDFSKKYHCAPDESSDISGMKGRLERLQSYILDLLVIILDRQPELLNKELRYCGERHRDARVVD